jgi:hypothetical protein
MEPVNAIRRFYLLSVRRVSCENDGGHTLTIQELSTPIQKTLSTHEQGDRTVRGGVCDHRPGPEGPVVNPAMERITAAPPRTRSGRSRCCDNAYLTSPGRDLACSSTSGNRLVRVHPRGLRAEGRPFNLEARSRQIPAMSARQDRQQPGDRPGHHAGAADGGADPPGPEDEAIGTLAGVHRPRFNNILSAIFGYAELRCLPRGRAKTEATSGASSPASAGRARDTSFAQILTIQRRDEQENRPLEPGRPDQRGR